jgi:ATP-dependent Clp protease ATP-binding subunit ClpX
MTDEFMGRVTVVKLNDLDVEDIKRIMLESDESAMKIQKEIFEQLGVKLTFTDSFTQSVAEKAYEKKSGARGINSIIDECTWKAFDEVYSHPGEYEEVIVSDKTIEDEEAFQLIKKRGN